MKQRRPYQRGITDKLIKMQPGDELKIEMPYYTARSYATILSALGKKLDKKFHSKYDKDNQTMNIIRTL